MLYSIDEKEFKETFVLENLEEEGQPYKKAT